MICPPEGLWNEQSQQQGGIFIHLRRQDEERDGFFLWKQVQLLNRGSDGVREAGNVHGVSWKGSEDVGVGGKEGH